MKRQQRDAFEQTERAFAALHTKPLKERVDLVAANARALDAEADALINEYAESIRGPLPVGTVRYCEVDARAFGLHSLRGLLSLQKKLGAE